MPNPVQDFADDEIDWTFDTGFRGSLWAMQAAFPHLRGRDGRVINFGSFYGVTGQAGTLAYNVTGDIGPAALFLAGPDSRYVTGQTLAVDGGLVVHS